MRKLLKNNLTKEIIKPKIVKYGIYILWTSWIFSLAGLIENWIIFHPNNIWFPIILLCFQAAFIDLINMGSRGALIAVIIILLIGIPGILIIIKIAASKSIFFAALNIVQIVLKVSAVVLLSMSESRQWFAKHSCTSE
jgi:hypothetical protein